MKFKSPILDFSDPLLLRVLVYTDEIKVPENLLPGKLNIWGYGKPRANCKPQDIFIPEKYLFNKYKMYRKDQTF